MSRQLVVRPEAERDIAEAFRWYEERQAGLGSSFLEAVEAAKILIEQHPELFAPIHREVRRALTKRFPFAVFYLVETERVVVLAILHQASDPERWRSRA